MNPGHCQICGSSHEGLAFVLGQQAPYPWVVATDEERSAGGLTPDTCVLPDGAGTAYFVRAHLELPIVPADSTPETVFVWSVWMSLSEKSYERLGQTWDDPNRGHQEPMPSWFCSDLPYDPSPLGLGSRVVLREPGVVPYVELDPSEDHPLVRELYQGITLHRVMELNQLAFAEPAPESRPDAAGWSGL